MGAFQNMNMQAPLPFRSLLLCGSFVLFSLARVLFLVFLYYLRCASSLFGTKECHRLVSNVSALFVVSWAGPWACHRWTSVCFVVGWDAALLPFRHLW